MLLLEIVEWGLLNGVEWSNEDTAIEARDLDSVKNKKFWSLWKKWRECYLENKIRNNTENYV